LSVAQLYDRFFTHQTFGAVIARAAVVTAVAYGLALLSYHFLEQRLLRRSPKPEGIQPPQRRESKSRIGDRYAGIRRQRLAWHPPPGAGKSGALVRTR